MYALLAFPTVFCIHHCYQVLTKEEGGRYTPFMQNYRPQCFVRTADITVALTWPEGTEDAAEKMIMPGDNVEMLCDLVFDVALEVGTRFTLREANKTSKPCLISLTHGKSLTTSP